MSSIDPIFSDGRLAAIYDLFDGPRTDLDVYAALLGELGVRSVLDIGCGTGTLACQLAAHGMEVFGLDPAAASLDVAQTKPHAEKVTWLCGDVDALPPLQVDAVTMTGNVAQVFLTDAGWFKTLRAARDALRPDGSLVFEARRPERKAWQEWTPERSLARVQTPASGAVTSWVQVTDVRADLVSFRWTFYFDRDGIELASDSTLRFRSRSQIEDTLTTAGFSVADVRDAPDRPGREFVFIARPSE